VNDDAPPPTPFDPERFRAEGRALVDWIADYWATLASRPVTPTVAPGEVLSRLPARAPAAAEPLADVLADLERIIVPGLTHWQHPSFFGYFPASASGPSILGELLSAGIGVQGMLWATSPACTELETRVLDWLRDLLGLPERFSSGVPGGGVIQDSASSGTLVAMIAARERATAAAVDADTAAGRRPFFIAATVGTTASGGIDPVAEIAAVAARHAAWLHVDAAWAGAAAICPEFREALVAGADRADSWGFNPHKWLLVNFDCHALWVADRRPLVSALSMKPDYLRNRASESGAVTDYCDWQVPLGRRFRALKLWMTLRMLGSDALRGHIRRHVAWASEFGDLVAADARFDLLLPPNLSLVCFALRAGDGATRDLLDRVNATGRTFLTHARVCDRFAIRLAVGGATTTHDDVLATWRLLESLA
jgi:aromatic-L-amino-acid decarboxylase